MADASKAVAWVNRGTKRAHVIWIDDCEREVVHGARLYAGAGPHIPSEIEAVELTRCCGREECGGECGNPWRGMEWVAIRRDSPDSELRARAERAEAEVARMERDAMDSAMDYQSLRERLDRAEAELADMRARVEAAPVGRVKSAGWTYAEVRIDDESVGGEVESLHGTRVRLVAEG